MITTIDIEKIDVLDEVQPRLEGIDEDHVAALEESPEKWPAIQVVRRGDRYVMVDGCHREIAALNLGMSVIQADVIEEDDDLRVLAFRANRAHGLPLSLSSKRYHAEYLLRLRPQSTNMAIADEAGLSGSTVAAIRARLEADDLIDTIDERTTRSGQVYTVTRNRQLGELPEPGTDETVGGFFSSEDRRRHRRIAGFLRRVSDALSDIWLVEEFDSAEIGAEACLAVMGKDGAAELAQSLGVTASCMLDVALCLGYQPNSSPPPEDGEPA